MNELPTVTVNNLASKTGLMIISAQITLSTVAVIWALKKRA